MSQKSFFDMPEDPELSVPEEPKLVQEAQRAVLKPPMKNYRARITTDALNDEEEVYDFEASCIVDAISEVCSHLEDKARSRGGVADIVKHTVEGRRSPDSSIIRGNVVLNERDVTVNPVADFAAFTFWEAQE